MTEPIDSTPKKNKFASQSKQDIIFFALNYFIPFSGLRTAIQDYLATDRMPLSYIFLLGVVCAIITVMLTWLTRNKKLLVKILVPVALLLIVIVINLFVI